MATGDFWDVTDPLKPFGLMDPDDVLTLPFDFAAWLTGQGTTYASHNLAPAAGLLAVNVSQALGVIRVNVSKDPAVALAAGAKYGVTCQLVAADGQKRSMTLWLKIREL